MLNIKTNNETDLTGKNPLVRITMKPVFQTNVLRTNSMVKSMAEQDIDLLDGFLGRVKNGAVPNAEALDGFFAALACCPDLIMPSEFMAVIQESEEKDGDLIFENMGEAEHFTNLVMGHWNAVNEQLNSGDIYLPVLIEDENGTARANDWAKGFVLGTRLRPEIWAAVFDDEEQGGALVPIFALAHENDPDPEMRPYKEPISHELREELIIGATAGVMRLHIAMLHLRDTYLPENNTFVRSGPKIGRNESCPCGSGKKYKKCCGSGPTIH